MDTKDQKFENTVSKVATVSCTTKSKLFKIILYNS